MMLRENWRKGVMTLSIIPITIVKNAVRIVTLSLLGAYVDPRILGSVAHRRGGIPIFLLALVLLGCVLWILRRGERKGCEK
jgi:exosortase/archaeosortase family protein